jgi:hypothetical protein
LRQGRQGTGGFTWEIGRECAGAPKKKRMDWHEMR